MMDLEEFRKYKKMIEDAGHKATKLAGSIEQLQKTLTEKVGSCDSQVVASVLDKLKEDKERAMTLYLEQLKKFQQKYGERLDGV